MLLRKIYSFALVSMQFIFILLLAVYANYKNLGFIQYGFIFLGLWFGVWAIFVMRNSKLRITPDVATGARLIKKGPYKYIRHPMYCAVLLFCIGLVLTNMYTLTLEFLAILFIVLLLKIYYEEKLLSKSFSNYKSYAKKTKKIIPFIY